MRGSGFNVLLQLIFFWLKIQGIDPVISEMTTIIYAKQTIFSPLFFLNRLNGFDLHVYKYYKSHRISADIQLIVVKFILIVSVQRG